MPSSSSLKNPRTEAAVARLPTGWSSHWDFGYLAFLYLPAIWNYRGAGLGMPWPMLWPTLFCTALFLLIHFANARHPGSWRRQLAYVLAVAALGHALLPINLFANTFVIYAVVMTAALPTRLRWRLLLMSALLAAFVLQVWLLRLPPAISAITLVIALSTFFGVHVHRENERRQAVLKLSQAEIRRLAALAERERIGRDLHDLLGHTLSLVALKSELAGRLIDADPSAARREITDVSRVARDALAQVRHAVTGIRAAGLAAELASARLLLESDGIAFNYTMDDDIELMPELETALALGVREAVTNIQRHARAKTASITIGQQDHRVHMLVSDDGRGGAVTPGNGLQGMRERIEALGGRLLLQARDGLQLHVELPLTHGAADQPEPLEAAS